MIRICNQVSYEAGNVAAEAVVDEQSAVVMLVLRTSRPLTRDEHL